MSGADWLTWSSVAMGTSALLINAVSFYFFTLPQLRDEHRRRQESRWDTDAYAPPWWMCWTYWVGLERQFFGHRMGPTWWSQHRRWDLP